MLDSKFATSKVRAVRPAGTARTTTRRPHVALIIETSKAYGRGLLRGIGRYVRAHGPWSIYIDERGFLDPAPAWLQQWDGDGIIARVHDRRMSEMLASVQVPVVDTLGQLPELGLPIVQTDDAAVVRAAIDHLVALGFRHFGFVTVDGLQLSIDRCQAAREIASDYGYSLDVYTVERGRCFDERWEDGQNDLADWIRQLPRPVGILAPQDLRALCILDACRRMKGAVPEEIAVIGVDNDEVLCDLAEPTLSSVPHDLLAIGYEAAAMLDQLMAGQPAPDLPRRIAPLPVVRRHSTDVIATTDACVVAALRFIRECACDGIQVEDVARHVGLSRRALERRFQKSLRRSPHAEVMRIRLERVKELLLVTDLTLEEIASRTGFNYPAYLHSAFKASLGQTPGEFRSHAR